MKRFDPVRYNDGCGWDWCDEDIKPRDDGDYVLHLISSGATEYQVSWS